MSETKDAAPEVGELRDSLAAANDAVQERTRELQALMRVSANLTAQLDLEPLLQLIIEEIRSLADYGRASIYLAQGEALLLLASRSRQAIDPPPTSYSMAATDMGPLWQQVARRQPVIIDDMHTDIEFVGPLRKILGNERFESAVRNVHAQLVVPLALKDRVIGMITLTHEQPAYYTRHHADLLSAIGIQAAIAIENARLFEQAQELAATNERQRLARELHDSVSQALYGIVLGARTARTLLETSPEKAMEPLDYVLSLAAAGQAEMRALLFELRPESLEMEGLIVALEKQIAATSARYALTIASDLGTEPELGLPEKEAFYRICQEALHNIVKHARAENATVRLSLSDGALSLEIRDDGVGFDTSASHPGHMGLISMSERASAIGGKMLLDSTPGQGSMVTLRLQLQET
jgi:signal transduction histidine kinase